MQKFEKSNFLHDLPRSGRKSLLCDRIPAVKKAIDTTFNENQSKSIRKVSRSTGVPSGSDHQIMRKCIGLYSYNLQMLQELKESDNICRLNFCAWLRKNYSKLNNKMRLNYTCIVTSVVVIVEFGQCRIQTIT